MTDEEENAAVLRTQAEQAEREQAEAMEKARDDAMNEGAIEAERAQRERDAISRHNDRDRQRRTSGLDASEIADERDDVKPSIGSIGSFGVSAENYNASDVAGKTIRVSTKSSGTMAKAVPRAASPELPSGASSTGNYGFDEQSDAWVEAPVSRARQAAKPMGVGLARGFDPGGAFKINMLPANSKRKEPAYSMSRANKTPSPINWNKRSGIDSGGMVVSGIFGNLFGGRTNTNPPSKKGTVAPKPVDPLAINVNIPFGGTTEQPTLTRKQKAQQKKTAEDINKVIENKKHAEEPVDYAARHAVNQKISKKSKEDLVAKIAGRNSADERYATIIGNLGKYASPQTSKAIERKESPSHPRATDRDEYNEIAGVKITTPPKTKGKGVNKVTVDNFSRYAGSVAGVAGLMNPDPSYNPSGRAIPIGKGRRTTVKAHVGIPQPAVEMTEELFNKHIGGERTRWEKEHPLAYQEYQSSQRQHDTMMRKKYPDIYHKYSGEPEPEKEAPWYEEGEKQKEGGGRVGSKEAAKIARWEKMNSYQKALFNDKMPEGGVSAAQLTAAESAQRKRYELFKKQETEPFMTEIYQDLLKNKEKSPYISNNPIGEAYAFKRKVSAQGAEFKRQDAFDALPYDERMRHYGGKMPQGWSSTAHKKTVSQYNARIKKAEGTKADIADYWREEGYKSTVEMREQKEDISNYWSEMASESRKEIAKDKELKDKAKAVASEEKAKKDKSFLESNRKAVEARLGGYNLPVMRDGKKAIDYIKYTSPAEAQKAKEGALREDYLKKTPLIRQLTDTVQKKKPYNDTKANREPGIFDYMKDEDIVDKKGKKTGVVRVKVNKIDTFKSAHPILTQMGISLKQEARKPYDDLMAGRAARADPQAHRGFLYGGGLQPVNITKTNPAGEFPSKSGRPARPKRRDPIGGKELAFFGRPFGAPKAPRRTRRGKVVKMTAAQRKRASRAPKSFLDNVFGGKW